ncbi:MAG: Ribose-5-phosphate isomerase B [Acidimicrobiales bacterium]|nr:MAG: RpiB/LacA/LacB family sugar-phosphate isomerase [Actinomycetota bacterium]MBV6508320.1 Ribose-5-phosphate isomerase B [Acidimicrobiales bacterium]RIK07101.1 MAG: galactose isomerase [Acidobacteriota bacterium]
MRIAFGTDEKTALSDHVKRHLEALGHDVETLAEDEVWTSVGRRVGEAVGGREADVGVVCCWTGTGVSIAANKVRGVRAALCTDSETAGGARRWNDANVLALSIRLTTPTLAEEIIEAFLGNVPDPGESETIAGVE